MGNRDIINYFHKYIVTHSEFILSQKNTQLELISATHNLPST